MNPTVYIETSVLSYLAARPSRDVVIAGYQQVTREWWSNARERFELVSSELVTKEARAGDADAARARVELLESVTLLDATEDAVELTRKLLDLGAVPRRAADDAAHVAIAVTNGVDYLVTWNFRHIANAACAPGSSMSVEAPDTSRRSSAHPANSSNQAMQKPPIDPIIAEIRAVRDAHAARFDYDVEAIFNDIRASQKASGRKYVSYPARRVAVGAEDRAGSAEAPPLER